MPSPYEQYLEDNALMPWAMNDDFSHGTQADADRLAAKKRRAAEAAKEGGEAIESAAAGAEHSGDEDIGNAPRP